MIALSDGRVHAMKYTTAHLNRFKAEVIQIQMPFNEEIPAKEQADNKEIYVRSRQESSKSSNIQDKEGGCTGWLFPRPRKESTLLNIHKKD